MGGNRTLKTIEDFLRLECRPRGGLTAWKKPELLAFCKVKGIDCPTKAKKGDVCKAIEEFAASGKKPQSGRRLESVAEFKRLDCLPRGGPKAWKKAELIDFCQLNDISCSAKDTKKELCARIERFVKAQSQSGEPKALDKALLEQIEEAASARARKLAEKARKRYAKMQLSTFDDFFMKRCAGRGAIDTWKAIELRRFCKRHDIGCRSRDTKDVLCGKITRHILEEEAREEASLKQRWKDRHRMIGELESLGDDDDIRLSNRIDYWIDQFAGFLWLLRRHRDKFCVPLRPSWMRSPFFGTHKCHFQICWFVEKEWLYMIYDTDELFWDAVENLCDKRFVIAPMTLVSDQHTDHSNVVIIDKERRTIERYEPYGHLPPEARAAYRIDELDANFVEVASFSPGYKYVPPSEVCPTFGPQRWEESIMQQQHRVEGDPTTGFCIWWSLWFADRRLKYPNLSTKRLAKGLMKTMIRKRNVKKFIREYAKFVSLQKRRLLRRARKYRNEDELPDHRVIAEALLWEIFFGKET